VNELYDSGAECTNIGGQTNGHNEEQSGLPSVVSDYLVQSVDQNL
jgi:hypothetical protein